MSSTIIQYMMFHVIQSLTWLRKVAVDEGFTTEGSTYGTVGACKRYEIPRS